MLHLQADPCVAEGVAALVSSTRRLDAVTDRVEALLRHDRATVAPLAERVLLVHDAPQVLLALGGALAALGVPVDRSATARDGLALARRRRPRVVVVDYDLGDGQPSGVQLVRDIGRGPHAVIITGRADPEELRALARSVDAEVMSLSLDVDHRELVERVRTLLQTP